MAGFQRLSSDNEKLKMNLYETQKQLIEIFDQRKDYLLKNYSLSRDNEQNIKNLKSFQLLNIESINFRISSINKLDEVIDVFSENIKRIKQFFLFFNENINDYTIFDDKKFEDELDKRKNISELKTIISINRINFVFNNLK